MAKRKPTLAQVQLHLQLCDLRREPRLRQAREWFLKNYFAASPEDAHRLTPPARKRIPSCAWW